MATIEKDQQGVHLSSEMKMCIGNLNARIASVNLAINDLTREIDNTLKTAVALVAEFQKEVRNAKTGDEAPERT